MRQISTEIIPMQSQADQMGDSVLALDLSVVQRGGLSIEYAADQHRNHPHAEPGTSDG